MINNNFLINIMEQYKNLVNAMETGDHSKNWACLKSQISRSIFLLLITMFFGTFMAQAADQTVSIDGLTTPEAIQTAIQTAIDATGGSGIVTVTGTTSSTLGTTLAIPDGVTLLWKASFSGGSTSGTPLLTIAGGAIEIAADGSISQTGSNYSTLFTTVALSVNTDSDVTISGGTVRSSSGIAISVIGENSTVNVSGGTVTASKFEGTIQIFGANSTVAVTGGEVINTYSSSGSAAIRAESENTKIILNDVQINSPIQSHGANSIISVGGNARVQGGNSTVIYSKGNVEIKDNAQVRATGDNAAIYLAGENGIVTVSGGTVSATTNGRAIAMTDVNGVVSISGDAIISTASGTTIDCMGSNSTAIISGTAKVTRTATSNISGGAVRAANIEVSGDAEISYNNGSAITASGNVIISGGTLTGGSSSGTINGSGSNSKITVTGGAINLFTYGVYGIYTGGSVVVSDNAKVDNRIWASGNVEVKDNAEVGSIQATGANSRVTVTGGTVHSIEITNVNNTGLNVIVGGTGKVLPTGSGRAIQTRGNVEIKDNAEIRVTTGNAIESLGANGIITISGGKVIATTGYAVSVAEANSRIIVSGGLAFAYSPVFRVANDNNFTGISSTGVVIGWNQEAGNISYIKGSATDIISLPTGCAKWDKVSDIGGIAYENGTNKGFIELVNITITDAGNGITIPQTTSLQIYPNPTSDYFIVDYDNFIQLKLYDMLGKEIMAQDINGKTEINIRHLPKGIYNVSILSEGRVVGNSKIVKQ